MAINFTDPTCGFSHREVVAFLNEQIVKNGPSRFFCRLQLCNSWSDLEEELQAIVTDSAIPRTLKKSCAWSALAMAVGIGEMQRLEFREKVRLMHDQLTEQRLFINALLGMVQRQRDKPQDERAIAESQFQQGLTGLDRVVGRPRFVTNMPLSVMRTQYQNQEGRRGEGLGTGTYGLSNVFRAEEFYDWTVRQPLRGGHAAAAAAAAAAPCVEETRFSGRANRNEADNYSQREIQRAWAQPCVLSSSSSVPRHFGSQVAAAAAAAEVKRMPIVPPYTRSRPSKRGRQSPPRKIHPEKVKPREDTGGENKKRSMTCMAGDWYCDKCNVMNFSWRNVCFKCKQFKETKVIEDFLHRWRNSVI
ncbi:testis-expressed protein 13A-like [Acomys russatus]|uniref:testis-expressed protein 13A-like n=1 Tax=Acomys russatus TaxID=60746 RepID=UPI0021E249AF|nr:testis-expressed protein 13A-like [Acomys russatus]